MIYILVSTLAQSIHIEHCHGEPGMIVMLLRRDGGLLMLDGMTDEASMNAYWVGCVYMRHRDWVA